ncbi:hypothetical protein [Stenotrophomonas sp. PS02298]|uniref:hypothetical protein n=1 Tax=Stenotrophomonas sp. PS02298 TaxID=2991424 RepID=UPI00249B8A32|nr:hypothetical protein [Stenotrophomonas sp. PS02298]
MTKDAHLEAGEAEYSDRINDLIRTIAAIYVVKNKGAMTLQAAWHRARELVNGWLEAQNDPTGAQATLSENQLLSMPEDPKEVAEVERYKKILAGLGEP